MSNKIKKKHMEQTTNIALVRFSQNLKTMSRQNVSLFCQHIFSLQQKRLILASIRRRTFQITIMIFLLTDFLQKLKLGKHSWYFSNSLLCKPDFRSATKGLFPLLKNKITLPPQQLIDGNILSLV